METRSSNSGSGTTTAAASGHNVCRICLVNGGPLGASSSNNNNNNGGNKGMESIFATTGEYGDKSLYSILVTVCAPLGEREMLAGIPERICRSCKWRLLSAYELHQTTLRSDEKMREVLEARKKQKDPQPQPQENPEIQIKIKQEVIDPDEQQPAVAQEHNQSATAEADDISALLLSEQYLPEAESTQMEGGDTTTTEMAEEAEVDPNDTLFEEHYKLNEKGNHSCAICEQEFPYKSSARTHILNKHDPAKPFKCDVCQFTFTSELRLIRHKAVFHGIGVIRIEEEKDESGDTTCTCQICSKTFSSIVQFKRHKNVHVAYNRPFKCDICLYRFTTKAQYNQHVKTHQEKDESQSGPETEWNCEHCDEKLPGKRALTMHVRRFHTQELQQAEAREKNEYKCIICSEAFARESVLNTHMKMHELMAFEKEREQRHEQGMLVKSSADGEDTTNSSYSAKKKSASDIAFVCVVCEQEFEERELLLKHQKKLHTELELNIVSGAQREESHMDDSATLENEFDEDQMMTDESMELLRSENGHPSQKPKCHLCQKTFLYNCLLQTHMKNSHSETKPFECKICLTRFCYRSALLKHELTHSAQNIRPGEHGSIMYKCKICMAKFLELKALNVHLKSHRPVEPIQPRKVEIFQCRSCPQIFCGKDKFDEHTAKCHRSTTTGGGSSGPQQHPTAAKAPIAAHARKNPDPRRVAERQPMSEKELFFGSLSIVKLEHPAEPTTMETM